MTAADFFTTIGTAGTTSLALTYLVNLLLTNRLKHEYDKKLEEYKASLTQQNQTTIERVKLELQEHSVSVQEQLQADRALYAKFIDTMPSNRCISQVGNANFRASYSQSMFKDLSEFTREWNNAQHEFMDQDIEAARTQLYELIMGFFDFLSEYSSHVNDDIFQIPIQWVGMPQFYYAELANSANRMSRRIYDTHQTLIRTAKNKLRV